MGLGLLGVIALFLVYWLLKGYVASDPRALALMLRKIAGSLGLGAGVPLLLSGRVAAGLILCAAGAWGLGWFSAFSQAQQNGRAPTGGEDADADTNARQARPARAGTMTKQEAYEILGLDPGAGADDIRAAHRGLIKKLHPDAGGVSALAAKVNEAKDILLK